MSMATNTDEESYSLCQLRYLLGDETSSATSSVANVCDVVSSAFCCSGSGGVTTTTTAAAAAEEGLDCATNEAAQDLWSCAFELYQCSMQNVTCAIVDSDDAVVNTVNGGALRRPGLGGRHLVTFGVFCFSCCFAWFSLL